MYKDLAVRNAKLRALLTRLESGRDVQNRDLRTWLSAGEYADYEYECETQAELRKELKNKPSAVTEYERRLRLALLAYNKGEGASTRGRHQAAKTYFNEADRLFERALEHLQEAVAADRGLCVWFDRDTAWTADSNIALAPSSMPRVVTSRSLDNEGGGLLSHKRTKRDVKRDAVERAIRDLERDHTEADELEGAQKVQLEGFLKLNDDDEF